jgi:hypothetical protein
VTAIIILSAPVAFYKIVTNNPLTNSYLYFVIGFLGVRLFDEIIKDRYYELSIDRDNKLIIIKSRRTFYNKKTISLKYDNIRLEIKSRKSNFPFYIEPITLYFIADNTKVATLNQSKDGYSIDTLNQICEAIKNIPLPVKTI